MWRLDVDAKIAREEGEVSLCGVKSERERERWRKGRAWR